MRVSQRRSNIEIIGDILRVSQNGTCKTKIMYNVNMSYSQIQKYLGFLMSQGYIVKAKVGNPSVTYRPTKRGLKLLKSIDNFMEVLG